MILADTNILLRSLHPNHPHYDIAKSAVKRLRLKNETLCVATQNLIEFWAVATRPLAENGLGLPVAKAAREIDALRDLFLVLSSTSEVLWLWQQLARNHSVIGKQTHDAHLVAIMQANSVETILTFNGVDFRRFPGIGVLDPEQA